MLVRQHLRLGFLAREQPLSRRALARFRRAVEPYVFEALVVSLADRMATRGEKTSPKSIARHFRLAREVWEGLPPPAPRLLSGDDVMRLLGVPPGSPRRPGARCSYRKRRRRARSPHARRPSVTWPRGGKSRGEMPELPEVETVRRRLEPALTGKRIAALTVADATVSAQTGRRAAPPGAGTPRRRPAPARQVPHRRPRRGDPGRPPAHDGAAPLRASGDAAAAALHDRVRRREPPALLRRAPLRAPVGVARRGRARALLRRARRRAAEPGLQHGPSARPARGTAGAAQGVPARPAAHRRRGQHLRRRGAVPRRAAPAAPGRLRRSRVAPSACATRSSRRSSSGSPRPARRSTASSTPRERRAASRRCSTSTSAPASPAGAAARPSSAWSSAAGAPTSARAVSRSGAWAATWPARRPAGRPEPPPTMSTRRGPSLDTPCHLT